MAMMSQEQAAQAVWDMLGAAVEGRAEDAARMLGEIGADSDGPRLYGVCCALAEAGRQVLHKLLPTPAGGSSDRMYAMQEVRPGGLSKDPADTWAVRFLVAWANHDTANTDALFSVAVAMPGDGLPDCVCALLATVTSLILSVPTAESGN